MKPELTDPDRRHWLVRAAAAAAAAGGLAGTAHAAIPSGTRAPDFTLRNGAGGNLRLAEQRGRIVMVNFWATWCAPCRQEMPHLERIHQKYKPAGFVLLGVSVDDDPRNAVSVAQKLGVTFPILLDTDKQVSRAFDVRTMPSTVLLDRDGTVRFAHRGYRDGYEATYEQQVRELLRA
jgi:peroxiredoxin